MTSLQSNGGVCSTAHENNTNLILLQTSPGPSGPQIMNHRHSNSQPDTMPSHHMIQDQNHMTNVNNFQVG